MDLNPTSVTTLGLRINIMRQARPPRPRAKIISIKMEGLHNIYYFLFNSLAESRLHYIILYYAYIKTMN